MQLLALLLDEGERLGARRFAEQRHAAARERAVALGGGERAESSSHFDAGAVCAPALGGISWAAAAAAAAAAEAFCARASSRSFCASAVTSRFSVAFAALSTCAAAAQLREASASR